MCIVVGLRLRKGRAAEEEGVGRMRILVGSQMMMGRGALGSKDL